MPIQVNTRKLRSMIAQRGYDHESFAREAGISASTLSHLLAGRHLASSATFRRICLALTRIPELAEADSLLEGTVGSRRR